MVRRHLWLLLVLILLGLILTWPMAAHFASHVPGDGIDDPSLTWNLWWIKHSLVDQPQNPFACDWQFWPVGINLAFYTLTILNGLLSIPLQVTFGVVPAYNLLLLSSFVLSGYGAYLLCLDFLGGMGPGVGQRGNRTTGVTVSGKEWTVGLSLAAFLGGTLYAFASAKMFYAALGQGNIASSQWIPFAALYLLRAARPPARTRDAALAALFLILQAYAELTYASFLVILAGLIFLWGGWRLARGISTSSAQRGTLKFRLSAFVFRFALIGVLLALGIAPFLANMLPDMRAEGDFFSSGGGFSDLFSADLAGYALPTQLHPVLGGLIRALSAAHHFPVNKGQQIYLGYTAMALALVGMWRGRRKAETWFWSGSALLFFLLTLGPSLRVAGHDLGVPLPFALVFKLPFFEGNRYPSRYSVMLLLSLAPLVAFGAFQFLGYTSWITRAKEGRRTTNIAPRAARPILRFTLYVLLVTFLLFEHLSIPLPLSDLRVPALYDQVAAQPGDFALLELPPGWRNGARVLGKKDIVIMRELWDQSRHGKRLLGGNTSRNPEFKFQYFSEDPTLARLIALINAADLPQHAALRSALAADAITEADRERARDWAATLNVRYVMVHRDKLPPETERTLKALLPVELVGAEGDLALYAVIGDLHPPRTFAVGDDRGRVILAEGWSPPALGVTGELGVIGESSPVYAQRREARLLLPLGIEATHVQLRGWSLAPQQKLTLVVDGREISSQTLSQPLGRLTFDIPADPARPPLSDVRLRFSHVMPVTAIERRPWPVGRTGAASPVSILVRSAGEETGDFGHIYVDGVELSPNRRGYNLVALDPADGHVIAAKAFDTHADAGAGLRLAEWVGSLPPGALVAGAVRDEASMNLGQEALDALRSLGVGIDLRGHFRWGHAFIGVVGASPGTAVEIANGIRPAQVSVGLPVSARDVAAALVKVTVGK